MKIDVLSRAKKKKFVEGLSSVGIDKISEMLLKTGKEKVRAFSGDLTREEVLDLWHLLPIEGVGLYVGKDMINRNGVREVRLSLDGAHMLVGNGKNDPRKGAEGGGQKMRVVELTEEQEDEWFLGKDVELSESQGDIGDGFVLVKGGKDFVGTGKVGDDGKMLFSFLPKERRRKERVS